MHLLATTSASLDDLIEPVDLQQTPAEMAALSFTDSDLAALRAAARGSDLPSLRLASLRDLRHPLSIDLWIDQVAIHASVILVRILGGYDWWSYGCERLAAIARERNIQLVLLPGECRVDDERLTQLSTISQTQRAALLDYFREGGPENMRSLLRSLARLTGRALEVVEARPLAKQGFYAPGHGVVTLDFFVADAASCPLAVLLIFYRSILLAEDVQPIDALRDELHARGVIAVPIFVQSLRDETAIRLIEQASETLRPSAVVTTTAFASASEPSSPTLFDKLAIPIFQAIIATTRRDAWTNGQRGLTPADLAMHVVLPELDGRILAGAISFKQQHGAGDEPNIQINQPEPDRIAQVATRIACFLKLQATPRGERRLAILIPDYPNAPGRAGYAVGLDVPASVLAMLYDLRAEGYHVQDIPSSSRALMQQLEHAADSFPLQDYLAAFARLPETARTAVLETWGAAEGDAEKGFFQFRAASFGNITVCFAPDRGCVADRRINYHDPALAPRHALVAFGTWLREKLGCHAIVHVGAHGTLEWLPGKNVALSRNCFPEVITGALPVVYPFIVSNPGEAAQAKRRISAVTIGHLTPPLTGAGLSEPQRELERLLEEYAQADGLDRQRRDRLAKLILATARRNGLACEAGIGEEESADTALLRIDAWLCDLKDFAIKDGLHIFGRTPENDGDLMRAECARRERAALLAALDGKHVAPGPSGAPARGRTDVLPTGRNLFTADPRMLPTPTAYDLGKAAAAEVVRRFLQDHGEWPRALMIDLWGSASLRTGGEEIAQGLALMGCRPQWDAATGRVVGIEVLPPATLEGPRIDVTWRVSGLFRDMFPTQIALLDLAVRTIAAREETTEESPLSAAARAGNGPLLRIFGSAPGTYGAGIEELLARGAWQNREELGRAYLDAASHAFGGAEGEGRPAAGAFVDRVVEADLLLHNSDDAGRDILEGSADVAFMGGFAAAVAALNGKADVVVLDSTDPTCPRTRSLVEAITRTVRARALNPRFIAGQLRHGPRGAAEFAETVDRLVGFAETTGAIPGELIEALYDAYLGDATVRKFLLRENPAAARAIAARLASARRRDLWHPQRNSIDHDLARFTAEAMVQEAVR